MRVGLYARVSTSDGRQHTDNQVDELVAWAARLGHEVHRVYCDRITGTKGAEDRPALAEALRDAHERRYDVACSAGHWTGSAGAASAQRRPSWRGSGARGSD